MCLKKNISDGAGNIPSNRTDILQLFREATARGVIIISDTQCVQGKASYLLSSAGYLAVLVTQKCLLLSRASYLTQLSLDET